ncbi:MAG: SRPBCC family protein [Actinomycetota bacterium]|nr:SRPBCC family protein [Actinomycetota bacterium]
MSSVLVRESVVVAGTPEQVWSFVVDWPRQSEWIPATKVWGVTEGAGVGAQIEAWTGKGRFGYLDTMTITAWDPPHRCEVLHTGRMLRGEGGFVVAPAGSGRARLEWWERFTMPGGLLGRLLRPLARPVLRVGVRLALRSLQRGVEQAPA